MSSHGNNGIAVDLLKAYIARIERVEEEQQKVAAVKREIYAEARGNGFCTKTMRSIIKLRKLDKATREEEEALLDIYKGALGMLNDTPLGQAAIRRLTQTKHQEPQEKESKTEGNGGDQGYNFEAEQEVPQSESITEEDIESARVAGRSAALEGKTVISNPYPAHDPRRAAWDEAWCAANGSDGMEVPEAWQRKKSSKKNDQPKGGE